MNDTIKEYVKAIGREKRKDIMIIGFFATLIILFLSFALLLFAFQAKLLNSRTAIDLYDGSVKKLTVIDGIKAREMEAYHQARFFMDNFFEYDKSNYKTRLNRALWIGDNSVKKVYGELMKNGWYNNVIDGNLRQYISYKNENIVINFNSKPYKVNFKFDIILRSDNYEEEVHSGAVTFYLEECSIDMEHNPHGYEVKNLEILNFK